MSKKALEVIVTDGKSSMRGALERAAGMLEDIPRGYEIAVTRALKRSVLAGRTKAISMVRQNFEAKASGLRAHFRTSVEDGEAILSAAGGALPLRQYKVRPTQDTTGNARKLVRVAVKKGEGLKPVPKAFIYHGKVLRRTDNPRGVKELYAPAIPMLVDNDEVIEAVESMMVETFVKRIDHEANDLLANGVRRKGKR